MADIDVVPKSRRNVWLWIILAIVVALIIWAIVAGTNRNAAGRVGMVTHGTPMAVVAPVPAVTG
jgi:hypothetical protein